MHSCNAAGFCGIGYRGAARTVGDQHIDARIGCPLAGVAVTVHAGVA